MEINNFHMKIPILQYSIPSNLSLVNFAKQKSILLPVSSMPDSTQHYAKSSSYLKQAKK